jgi:3-oxoacyl-[acyl-carrier protein] reductase
MLRDISGTVALVTGASRGIGEAVAIRLAQAGCDVALTGRNEADLERVAVACRAHDVRALALVADITDPDALQGLVADTVSGLGGLGVLVNNAGIYASGRVQEADIDAFERVIDVNVKALMRLTRLALPHILESSHGAVINIASVAGKGSFPGGAAYCASKHAVVGFTGSLYEDVRRHGVKVCAICPGFVNTSMVNTRPGLDPARMIQPADIAEAAHMVVAFPDTACPTEILIRPQRSPYI